MAKRKNKNYRKQHYKDIYEALAACPKLCPESNPLIATGPNTAKIQHPFPQGLIAAKFIVENLAIKLRALTKLDIIISFDYVCKETGEIKQDKVIRNSKTTFLKSL